MSELVVKDSGKRDTFATGAVRDGQTGKGAFHLLPFHALFRVAAVYEAGATKYAARNWEKGIPMSRFLDSGTRHRHKYLAGWRDEDHLAMSAWNDLCALETEYRIAKGILPAELFDIPEPDERYGANTSEILDAYGARLQKN